MKSREQKTIELETGEKLISESKNLVFTDFSGVSVTLIQKLKKQLKEKGGAFRVIKKRLLRIALKNKGYEMDTKQFDGQVGTIFLPDELSNSAGSIYQFSRELKKEGKEFNLLGAYDLEEKSFMDAETFTAIAKLPSRDILLGQFVGVLVGPMRAFMYLLQEIGKQGGNQEETAPTSAEGEVGVPTLKDVGKETSAAKPAQAAKAVESGREQQTETTQTEDNDESESVSADESKTVEEPAESPQEDNQSGEEKSNE